MNHWIAVGLDVWSFARFLTPALLIAVWEIEIEGVWFGGFYQEPIKPTLLLLSYSACVLAIIGVWT